MTNNLDKLNRLRGNAGKPELKAWKASQSKLVEAIQHLEAQGFVDVLPGAKLDIKPITDDPQVARALPKDDEPEIRKNPEDRKPPEVKKQKAQLARGLETEQMARQSRVAVQMERERERREEKAARIQAKADAKAAEAPLAKGQVDPKKDPEKAARQQKHIEDKKASRAAKPDKPKSEKPADSVTVAEICRGLDIDPKIGRAKLRRPKNIEKLRKLHSDPKWEGKDWTFPSSARAAIVSILK